MADYGRNVIGSTGTPVEVAASTPYEVPVAGITIDWSTVGALGSDTTYPDGLTARSGTKALRYGQVLAKITNTPVWTITPPGSGTFAISDVNPNDGSNVTSGALAFNASLATVQAAADAMYGAGAVVVTGTAGTTYVLTYTLNGAAPTVSAGSIANTTVKTNYGMYGPFDPAASDGRQTLTRNAAVILNTTVLKDGVLGFTLNATSHPGCIVGGVVWLERIIQSGTATHTLALGPTLAELLAAFPTLKTVGQS